MEDIQEPEARQEQGEPVTRTAGAFVEEQLAEQLLKLYRETK